MSPLINSFTNSESSFNVISQEESLEHCVHHSVLCIRRLSPDPSYGEFPNIRRQYAMLNKPRGPQHATASPSG